MMEHLNMQSMDKVAANVAKIRELFPNCVTERINKEGKLEHAIDFDMLKQELSDHVVDGLQERYQFTWPDKRKAILAANAPINKTLRPCREESVDFDNTENLYIEGDNLEVLKLLQETYLGKVKMIYIDPPYNTGNDFVYEDDFKQSADEYIENSGQLDGEGNRFVANTENNGRFHTDWLNMIYPRLKLAKDLLSDDGVVLINIDEHEVNNLQKVLVEIFGEVNDLGTIIWDKRNPKGDAQGISYQHEYILVYAKNSNIFLESNNLQRPKKNANEILEKAKQLYKKVSERYTLEECNKDFVEWIKKQKDFSGGERAYNKIDSLGNVFRLVSMAWPNKKKAPDDYFIPLIHPVTGKPCPVPARGWRNPSKTMKKLLEEGKIVFGTDEKTQPTRKYLLKENMEENIPSLLYYGGSDVELLKEFNITFDTPKVVNVCVEHIRSFTNCDSMIVDFFSGSATTAHAVMQLNAEDGGKRKFIMVQLQEECAENSEAYKAGYKNICEIGKERIRRAGQKIKEENPLTTQDLDIGFRVLKCDSSNMEDVYFTPKEYMDKQQSLFIDNIKKDRSDEDLLFDAMLKLDTPLSSKIEKITIAGKNVYNVAQGHLMACFDKNVTDEVITAIAKEMPSYFVMRDSSQADDSVAINFEQIFNTYSPQTVRRVL